MKFWSGFDGNELEAARACIDGGWIPASAVVTREPSFQEYLAAEPAFAQLVMLAGGEHQIPYPSVPGGAMFRDEVTRAAEQAMYRGRAPEEAMRDAARHIRARLEELTGESH